MTQKETIKFLALVKLAYPNAYKDIDDVTRSATIKMWFSEYQSVPYTVMEMALEKYKQISKFQPSLADISECLSSLYWSALEQYDIAEIAGNEEIKAASLALIRSTSDYRMGRREKPLINSDRAAAIAANDYKLLEGT